MRCPNPDCGYQLQQSDILAGECPSCETELFRPLDDLETK